ncbi:MAG: RrF2 family transcriptional regulator [Candidatus Binatia bacterium]
MHLFAQEEYGLRCLAQLVRGEGEEGPLRIQDIAEAEGLSSDYVAKLMGALRKGGLVTSTRGASGGYRLARPAEDITLWQALGVLGGSFFSDEFCDSHPGQLRDCLHTTDCSIRALWRWLSDLLQTALDDITLADLARKECQTIDWLTELRKSVDVPASPFSPRERA